MPNYYESSLAPEIDRLARRDEQEARDRDLREKGWRHTLAMKVWFRGRCPHCGAAWDPDNAWVTGGEGVIRCQCGRLSKPEEWLKEQPDG